MLDYCENRVARIKFIVMTPLEITVTNAENKAQNEAQADAQTWMCLICGWIYDEAAGDVDSGIAPGTRWADISINWTCPECGARKEDFEMVRI